MNPHETKKLSFIGHKDCVYTLCEGPLSGTFFSAGADGMVVLWNIENPETGKPIAHVPSSVYALYFIKRKNQLLIASNLDGLHLIDLENNKEIWSFQSPKNQWFRMKENDDKIWVAGSKGMLLLFDTESQIVELKQLGTHDLRAMSIDFENQKIFLGNSNQEIFELNINSGLVNTISPAHKSTIFGLQIYPFGSQMASAGRDAKLILWGKNDTGKWEVQKEVAAHLFGIHDVILHPTRPVLATASTDKTIKIWDAETLKLLRVIDKARHAGHGFSINQLLWLKDSELLLSCSDDRTISAWDIFA